MRLIIYNGKGGVGKTSVSTATALRCARFGHRTILMSVDTAHSIGDSLDMKLGPVPQTVAPNLDVLELDIVYEMKTKWSAIKNYISAFMLSQGIEDLSADELAIFPGMEMVSALLYVLTFKREKKYDVVIIDTAPTGETLRLMSFPDVSSWYIDKVFSIATKLMGIARATVGHIIDFPLPSKEAMDQIKYLKDEMKQVKKILEDSENTTVRLVLNPEKMAISETRRSYAYMCLYNKNVECLVVNKVIPEDAGGGFLKEKLREQKGYLEDIHGSFDPLEIKTAYMMRTEMCGIEKLNKLADMIFGSSDPADVYSGESPMKFVTLKGGIVELRIKMPFVQSDEVELFKGNENTIILHVGNQKRTVSLPMSLSDAELLGAEFGDNCLIVRFRRPGKE